MAFETPSPIPSAGASSFQRAVLPATLALGGLGALAGGAIVYVLRDAPDPESVRLMLFGAGPALVVAAVASAIAMSGTAVVRPKPLVLGAIAVVLAAGVPSACAIILTGGAVADGILFPLAAVPMALLLGVLAGLLVLWPLSVLIAAPFRGRSRPATLAALTAATLLLLTASAIGVAAAVEVHGGPSGRGTGLLLFAVIAGIPVPSITVTSEPMLWLTRALAVLMVACIVALVRIDRREGTSRARSVAQRGRRPRGNRYRGRRDDIAR